MYTDEQDYHDDKKRKGDMTHGGLFTAFAILCAFWIAILYFGCS